MWDIHTTDDYSAIKRNEGLIHAIPQMNSENIMLKERRDHKRAYILRSHFHEISVTGKSTDTESRSVVARSSSQGGVAQGFFFEAQKCSINILKLYKYTNM